MSIIRTAGKLAREVGVFLFTRLFGGLHVFLYRKTGGRLGWHIFGLPMLLLTTTGRKSGRQRTRALTYLRDGDDLVVMASYGGLDRGPAWWLNLQANPEASVQIGSRTFAVRAEQATPAERERLWPRVVRLYSGYASYQRATERQIPLVKLRTAGPTPPAPATPGSGRSPAPPARYQRP